MENTLNQKVYDYITTLEKTNEVLIAHKTESTDSTAEGMGTGEANKLYLSTKSKYPIGV